MGEVKHVMAKDLTHVAIRGTVHLWHCVDNNWKSLTNSPQLDQLEKLVGFDIQEFIERLANEYNFRKGDRYEFKDGFAFVDHHTQTGNYIISDKWTKQVEKTLADRGYLTYK